jgi:hypothetical protein
VRELDEQQRRGWVLFGCVEDETLVHDLRLSERCAKRRGTCQAALLVPQQHQNRARNAGHNHDNSSEFVTGWVTIVVCKCVPS